MIEGSFKAAQEVFDSAFAVPKVKQSPVYPILLNEQATLLVFRRRGTSLYHEKECPSLSVPNKRSGKTY